MIKVLLADDHKILTDSLKSFLEKQPGIEVAGVASNGKEAIELLEKHPDIRVAVLDIEMPEMDGIETTRKIRERFPDTEVLILSMYDKKEFVINLFENGMSGYVLKNKSAGELVSAIHAVAQGNTYISLEIGAVLKNVRRWGNKEEDVKLTRREKQVLCQMVGTPGDTYEMMAEKMKIALYTVHTHVRNIKEKLGVNTKSELVQYGMRKNVCDEK